MIAPSEQPPQSSPRQPMPTDQSLPPVEPPGAGFILQLFFIPLLIVAIIVVVWLLFSWLAQMGTSPHELVRGLHRADDAAWQKAGILADLLRDNRYEDLRYDAELASEVAEVLRQQLDEGGTRPNQINLRIFLCRALGEFHVPDGLPALLQAATVERDAAKIERPAPGKERKLTELDVRRAALEAIAVLIQHVGPEQFRQNAELQQVLVHASKERGDPGRDEPLRRELRSTAAFVLGVLGGQKALDRLVRLLDDPYVNARCNAATGLARHGDARAIPVLVEMLDPDNAELVRDEPDKTGQAFKRSLVITNAIKATLVLARKNHSDDLKPLEEALRRLTQAPVPSGVRVKAREALEQLKRRTPQAG